MQQKRNQESIIDCIDCKAVYQFQRCMVSLCGKWKHFTSLICGLIPHSGLSSMTGEEWILHCSSHFSGKEGQALILMGCSTFAQALSADPSHLQCLCKCSPAVPSQYIKDQTDEPEGWRLEPKSLCSSARYGGTQSRREKVEENRSMQGDNSEHFRYFTWDCVKFT